MKQYYLFRIAILCFSAISLITNGQEGIPKVEKFLPDIVSQFPNVRDLAMSPDGDEIYFTIQSHLTEINAIVNMRKEKEVWSNPEVAIFSGKYNDLEPFVSPDGLRLFFVSDRPVDKKSTEPKDYDIWFLERKDVNSPWSEPINIGPPVNTKDNEFYPSVALSNNLYFTSDGEISTGKDGIFVSSWVKGKYEYPVSLGDSVNTTGYEFNAFIAPDESFLIYTCFNRKDGAGSGDLYISHHKSNGQWSTPENLDNNINSAQMDYCPFFNIKTGILYFTSKRSLIATTSDKNRNLAELIKEMNQFENGQSRLYWIKLNSMNKK